MITNFRRYSTAGLLAASVAVGIGLAAPAHADGEAEFLQLINDNIPGANPYNAGSAAMYVHAGNMACGVLRNGGTKDEAIAAATLLPWSPKWASKAVVEYAPQTMCPDVKH
ncbi:DUF732 domain-containing protein [Mycobacterium sp. NPDC050853]|uniref:DUF732 domain-containing protein n=1 Tax=Mycobacteriaceae TaxID=1762 RepID=UPI0015DF7CE4|nr:DUF732 domain-containing protein [Mycobacteroides sp. LB1]